EREAHWQRRLGGFGGCHGRKRLIGRFISHLGGKAFVDLRERTRRAARRIEHAPVARGGGGHHPVGTLIGIGGHGAKERRGAARSQEVSHVEVGRVRGAASSALDRGAVLARRLRRHQRRGFRLVAEV